MIQSNKILYEVIEKITCENNTTFFIQFKNSFFSDVKNFKRYLHDNIIIEKEKRKELIKVYIKAKKIVNILDKFSYRFKIKKAIIYDYNKDLLGNELSVFPKNQLFSLYQNNTIYNFRITDLINIIKESLLKCDGLFPRPTFPKNPYTNIEFNKSHLYNLCIKINESKFHIPTELSLFLRQHLNIKNFIYYNYPYLKEKIIENFPNNSSNLFYEIKRMFNELKKYTEYKFLDVPITPMQKKKFIYDCKPCLVKWLKSLYSNNPNIRDYCKNTIIGDLKSICINNGHKCIIKTPPYRTIIERTPEVEEIIVEQEDSSDEENIHININSILSNNSTQNIVNLYNSRVTSLPNLLRPLINTNQTINSNESDIFDTIDRIPRSPINRRITLITPLNLISNNLPQIIQPIQPARQPIQPATQPTQPTRQPIQPPIQPTRQLLITRPRRPPPPQQQPPNNINRLLPNIRRNSNYGNIFRRFS
jgi:hypothetical protein